MTSRCGFRSAGPDWLTREQLGESPPNTQCSRAAPEAKRSSPQSSTTGGSSSHCGRSSTTRRSHGWNHSHSRRRPRNGNVAAGLPPPYRQRREPPPHPPQVPLIRTGPAPFGTAGMCGRTCGGRRAARTGRNAASSSSGGHIKGPDGQSSPRHAPSTVSDRIRPTGVSPCRPTSTTCIPNFGVRRRGFDHFAGTDDQQFGTILAQLAELTITQSEIIEDMEAAIVSLTAHLTALVDAS